MVTTFSELHNNVQQPRFALLLTSHTVDGIDILLQKTLVPLPLHLSHTDIKVNLLLWQERVLDIGFDSSKQERSEDFVELLDNGVGIGFVLGLEPGIKVLTGTLSAASACYKIERTHLEEKTSGKIKFNKAHSSCKLFCNGVPVISNLPRLTNVLIICERRESTFLIR